MLLEDQTVEVIVENPLIALVRNGPVSVKSNMGREEFHQFVLRNEEVKIERDKYGIITIHPPMTLDSGYYEGEAFGILRDWSKTNKRGRVFSPSTAFELPDGATCKADGSWISMEKLNQLSDEQRKGIAMVVPEFVMEIRSQTDRLVKLKKKITDIWMANGVRLAWLIDPLKEKAWVYRFDGSVEEVSSFSGILSGEDVLPGFEFNLKEFK